MHRLVLVFALTLLPTGCASVQDPAANGAKNVTKDQAKMRAFLEDYRTETLAGNLFSLMRYADILASAQESDESKAKYGDLDWAALNAEVEGILNQRISSVDGDVGDVWMKVRLQLVSGRGNEAVATFQAAHERTPSFDSAYGLVLTHAQASVPMTDAPGFCAAHRSLAVSEEQVYQYIQACAALNPSSELATSVPWASEADFEIYARVEAQHHAQAADREARQEAYEREDAMDAMAASSASDSSSGDSSSGGSSGSSGSAAPSSVSITLRNTCSSTVQVFFGDKPKFGSGKYSSLSSNSSTGMSFRPGDMIWIVDDSQNGISSVTVSASTRTVEVTSGCTGLSSN